jgi:hypothetical protein
MASEFAYEIDNLFPTASRHSLKTPLPANHNRPVEELTERMKTKIGPDLIKRMMEMNGCVLWVASSTRHDLRYAVHWCSTKIATPIFRDFYMCVHVVLYLVQTKMYPLLLGGPGGTDAFGFSDGSLHTGENMRSVGAYFVFASPLGGAIQSCTFETKYQVLNVMHVELDGITQLANALMYITHACQELNVVTPITRRIYTDSEAAQSHCLNNSATRKSKHLELRLQTVQDYQADDRIDVIHVAGGENCADQGTKSLDPELNLKHMMVILGHRMMPGKGIEGVQEYVHAKIDPVQMAYMAACEDGYIDVTTSEDYCDVVCSNYIFHAIVDLEDLQRVVDESVMIGQEDLHHQLDNDNGSMPLSQHSQNYRNSYGLQGGGYVEGQYISVPFTNGHQKKRNKGKGERGQCFFAPEFEFFLQHTPRVFIFTGQATHSACMTPQLEALITQLHSIASEPTTTAPLAVGGGGDSGCDTYLLIGA